MRAAALPVLCTNVALSLRSRRKHKAWGVSPRIEIKIEMRAHEMGDSLSHAKLLTFVARSVARIRGLKNLLCF